MSLQEPLEGPNTSAAPGAAVPGESADTPIDVDQVEEVVHTRQAESSQRAVEPTVDEAKEKRIRHALKTLYPERFKEKREKRKRKHFSPVYKSNKCSDCIKRYDDVVRRVHEELLSGRLTMAGVARLRKTRNRRIQTMGSDDEANADNSSSRTIYARTFSRSSKTTRAAHPTRCQCGACSNKGNYSLMKIMPDVAPTRVYRSNARPYPYERSHSQRAHTSRDNNSSSVDVAPRDANAPGPSYAEIEREKAMIVNAKRKEALRNIEMRDNAFIENALKNFALMQNNPSNSPSSGQPQPLNATVTSTDEGERRKTEDGQSDARCVMSEPAPAETQPDRRVLTRPGPIPFQAPHPSPSLCDDLALKDLHKHVIEEDLRTPGLIYLDILEDLHSQGPCRKNCQLRADVLWLRQRTHRTAASQTRLTREAGAQTERIAPRDAQHIACQTSMSSDVSIQKGNYFARVMSSKTAGTRTASTQASMPELPHLKKPINHVIGVQKLPNQESRR